MRTFAISSAAAAWIDQVVDSAAGDPRFVGMCPVLFKGISYETMDAMKGRVLEAYDGEFYSIGLDYRAEIKRRHYTEIAIGSRKVWIHNDRLAELFGKRLILETVQVGAPRAADKTTQLLLAVDL